MIKHNDRTLIEDIKNKLTLRDVIAHYGGAELHGEGDQLTGHHTAHTSISGDSLTVDNRQGVYHCFNCGQGGDIFSWAGHARWNGSYNDKNADQFKEVLTDLAHLAGVDVPTFDPVAAAERRSIEEIWQMATDYFVGQLTPAHVQYLTGRGFTEATIQAARIGYAPAGKTNLLAHLVDKGVILDDMLKTGLFHRHDDDNMEDYFQGRIVFPYLRFGRPVYFNARETTESPEWERKQGMKYKKLAVNNAKHPYISKEVFNGYFYGEDSAMRADALILTEGLADCLAAMQEGFAAISPCTTRFSEKDWPRLLSLTEGAKVIYIVNDNEKSKAGEQGALATAEMLWMQGRMTKIVTLPLPVGIDKIDLNDFLQNQGVDSFRALLPQAKTVLDLKIEAMAQATTDEEKMVIQREAVALIAAINDDYYRSKWADTVPALLGMGKREYNKWVKAATELIERADAAQAAQDRQNARTRPLIQINDRQLSAVADDALAAIVGHVDGPVMFVRGGALCRVVQDENGVHGIQELGSGPMLHLLSVVADWVKMGEDKRGEEYSQDVFPHQDVATQLLSAGEWKNVPALAGIVSAPVFGRDGSISATPGYNPKTHLLYTGGAKIGNVEPTPDNVAWAKTMILDELLGDFPFKDDASKAHAVAYALLPFVRDLISGPTPAHDVDSPTPGTGKGKLINACAFPFLGRDVPSMAAAKDDDEWRKRITTSMIAGDTHVVIDNVNHELDSGALATAFTERVWKDRTLGANKGIAIPIRTAWAITANNVKMSQEMARRCAWIRLDSNTEKPWERTEFRHPNLNEWVKANRDNLATALLTLINAWVAQGMPRFTERVKGSYEEWSGVLGGILEAVGIPGFLENEAELYERVVSKSDIMNDFIKAWWEKHNNAATSSYDLLKLASVSDNDADNRTGEWSNLLADILTSPSQTGRLVALGKLLGSNRDKVIAGYKIVFAKMQRGKAFWRLESAAR
ncbi:MAG: hypothetical protein IPL32_18300 [Chloracidobacterium sp.]|nr:hypothetical protein [Chloracidobacterium sp.]